jgi:hypothetical protein
LLCPAQVDDRQEQDREGGSDDEREQAARHNRAPGQPASEGKRAHIPDASG